MRRAVFNFFIPVHLFHDLHAKVAAVIAAPQCHASLPDQLRMQPGVAHQPGKIGLFFHERTSFKKVSSQNCCHPARCAVCFFSHTAAAMHQRMNCFDSSFFIFFASCASILWFSCKNRSGHFHAPASCFSPRSASDAARYS